MSGKVENEEKQETKGQEEEEEDVEEEDVEEVEEGEVASTAVHSYFTDENGDQHGPFPSAEIAAWEYQNYNVRDRMVCRVSDFLEPCITCYSAARNAPVVRHRERLAEVLRGEVMSRPRTPKKGELKPTYHTYKGITVNLTWFIRRHRLRGWTKSRRILPKMLKSASKSVDEKIKEIIRLKALMGRANKAASKLDVADDRYRDYWGWVGTLAGKLRVALAEINYNRDANGNRIFDTTAMYEDGDDGWQKIMRNAIKALKIYHTQRKAAEKEGRGGGRTTRIRKRKTRKKRKSRKRNTERERKTRKRKTRKRKTRKRKTRKRKTRKKRKSRKRR
tara:strand:- start:156 stop:1154 length:999 start_codon:yes stop_codon:yes gene_type:complete